MSGPQPTVSLRPDLEECAREPIHVPGLIQPHGALLTLREADLTVAQASRNTGELLGIPTEEALGQSLDSLFGAGQAEYLREFLQQWELSELNPLGIVLVVNGQEQAFDAIVHRTEGLLVLELEPAAGPGGVAFQRFYHLVRTAAARLQGCRDQAELCRTAVAEVRRITGFDRVMAYRFDAEWNGEVVAEEKDPRLEPYLGLHYPASDIPEQARRLYTINWLRLIANVQYQPVEIVPAPNPVTGKALDLTHSVLRSVSPVHLEYLRNMGVGASMSVSLMHGGRLWGLIACHHETARHLPYVVRSACEFLGQVVSQRLTFLEEYRDLEARRRLDAVRVQLLQDVAVRDSVVEGLLQSGSRLLEVVNAQGAALCFGEHLELVGETPKPDECRRLAAWLNGATPELFHSAWLAREFPPAAAYADCASGVLSVAISQTSRILWFRPEVVRVVHWAGEPEKAVTRGSDGLRLHPRRSFDLWKQEVQGRSLPWRHNEVEVAGELRVALVDRFLRDVEAQAKRDLERLNDQLTRSNQELDAFAHIASHDLKEPLRGIRNYADFLLEDYGERLDDEGRRKLEVLGRLSGRAQELIDALLEFSRVGRVDMAIRAVDLNTVVAEVVDLLGPRLEIDHATVSIAGPLPVVVGDRTRIGEIFNNLITNGIKYNESSAKHVEIGVREDHSAAEWVTLYVRDNGIGIAERCFGKIFDMFHRLHTRDRFGGGTGAGLAIVKKLVERHNGRIWLESTPGEGTTFFFTLPRK